MWASRWIWTERLWVELLSLLISMASTGLRS
jgi:hypothetical protein